MQSFLTNRDRGFLVLLVGMTQPHCPYGLEAIVGTHPIPQNYFETHRALGTWETEQWRDLVRPTLGDEAIRKSYD